MNILITGAASGIGHAAAEVFLNNGHGVFGIDIQKTESHGRYHGFVADITDEQSLRAVGEFFHANGIRLDAIVNIAGMHMMTSLVEGDPGRMKKIVDINLCGALLVNRIFHPFLREKGRVVIVTSEVAPLDPMPFNGLYSVTKTALDCYAQALRQELNLIGQKVITIRPGAVQTPLSVGSVQATANLADTTVLYQKQARRFSGLAAKFMGKPIAPAKLAALIYKAATVKCPKLIYQKNRHIGLWLLNLLPKRSQCAIIRFLLNI